MNPSIRPSWLTGLTMVAERLLHMVIAPRLRAYLLRVLGAKIGRNVRIHEVLFFNLHHGFAHLEIADDVHIGPNCKIDLKGSVHIGRGATISPGVTIISHQDPGSSHNHPLCDEFPPRAIGVRIGSYAWIGCNATLLDGSIVGERVVVGAAALVNRPLAAPGIYGGVPAKQLRAFNTDARLLVTAESQHRYANDGSQQIEQRQP